MSLRWTCHICGKERPDERISVYSTTRYMGSIPMEQNVRYCNDKLTCTKAAQKKIFVPTSTEQPG